MFFSSAQMYKPAHRVESRTFSWGKKAAGKGRIKYVEGKDFSYVANSVVCSLTGT